MSEIHRRYLPKCARKPELLTRSDGALPLIAGYAAVFYRADDPATEYEMWAADSYGPRVVERIMPRAFDKAIKEDDVRGLFNHDSAVVLGRSGAGTLRLSVDSVGLRYEIDPPDTQAARDLIKSLQRGDISGSSFAFYPRDTSRRDVAAIDGKPAELVIERNDLQLFDVGPVTFPAYTGASAGVRSGELAAVRAEVDRWRASADADAVAVALALMSMEENENGE
ncbi:Caudovirus prohead protease [Gemmata sp. SH-PL17]|uniref:HK97 family phage prohead protease n=1 Tax=Gemmata sp. SH-PL17 TaxID=1630693 RepID=UPI00078DF6E9|nr:HK97 family phage prohead protease [Gemmata sp. SH-PL17]AMV23431.1 Caudovirus prohead protease [Gemmata sp. SH-PL17]